MSYKRGDVVILPFPFVTAVGTQKLGELPPNIMKLIDEKIRKSVGLADNKP